MPDLSAVQFAVVRYVPDPLRDEAINVGIVARLEGRLVLRSVPNFGRIRRIAGVADTTSLELGLHFLRSALDRSPDISIPDLAANNYGILRFGDVLGGVADDAIEFVDEQYEVYVRDNAPVRSSTIMRRNNIREDLRRVMASRGTDPERFAIWRRGFRGRTGRHEFDFGFEHGKVSLVRAISLQTQEAYALSDARALSFAALDTYALGLPQKVEITAVVAPAQTEDAAPGHSEALHLLESNVDQVVILGRDNTTMLLDRLFSHTADVRPISNDLLAEAVA